MTDGNFFESLYEGTETSKDVEVPLNILLELAECRGRMCAMRDYAKAHKYNFNPNDLSIIGGFETTEGEKENASVQNL